MSLTLKDYLTASGRYPDREKHPEANLNNAAKLISAVRCLLQDIGYTAPINVSSGFRPSAVNAALTNAAAKSLHTRCLAVDLLDDANQSLGKRIAERPDVLRTYGLFIEDLSNTRGKVTNWVHLDLSPTRADRPSRSFKP